MPKEKIVYLQNLVDWEFMCSNYWGWYTAGLNACNNGMSLNDNPYEIKEECDAWIEGFMEGLDIER